MNKPTTVGDVIERVEQSSLRLVVYGEIQEFLSQFIPTDAFEPPAGIHTVITETGAVPLEVVEAVRDEIETHICELKQELSKLKGTTLKMPLKKVAKNAPARRVPPRRTRGKAKVKAKAKKKQ
ncbi:MAG: hypothetical protein KAY24_20010 [Candidatus Eisenbacteria sp.]|nr:hypothetical protein [Candidatus Eisenbacteria bacterium]